MQGFFVLRILREGQAGCRKNKEGVFVVELKNVSVTYQTTGIQALNNISLKVNDGEFAFVVGSSGAGKSTLIKLLLKAII